MSDTRSAWEAVAEGPAFYEALGRAIKVERTARGMERKDLAEASGLSYPYLSEIENGSKRPSSKALFVIAHALGISASELLQVAETWTGPAAGASAPVVQAPAETREPHSRWFAPSVSSPPPGMKPMQTRAAIARAMSMRSRAEPEERQGDRRRALLRELLEFLEDLPTEDLERLRNLARDLGLPTADR